MDEFFSKKTCDRCGHEFQPGEGRIMSKFNLDCICDACKRAERKHPDYAKACEAEENAVKRGERNFPGIGMAPVTVNVTVEVVHLRSFDVELTPAQWTALIEKGEIPGLDSMYAETDKGQPEEFNHAVCFEDGDEIIPWD